MRSHCIRGDDRLLAWLRLRLSARARMQRDPTLSNSCSSMSFMLIRVISCASRLLPGQRLVDSLQLFLVREIDLEPSALAFADDADARAERNTQAFLRGPGVGIDFPGRRCDGRRR